MIWSSYYAGIIYVEWRNSKYKFWWRQHSDAFMTSFLYFRLQFRQKIQTFCFSFDLVEIWYRGEFGDTYYKNKSSGQQFEYSGQAFYRFKV